MKTLHFLCQNNSFLRFKLSSQDHVEDVIALASVKKISCLSIEHEFLFAFIYRLL